MLNYNPAAYGWLKASLYEAALLSVSDAAWRFGFDLRNNPEERNRALAAALYLESVALREHRANKKR